MLKRIILHCVLLFLLSGCGSNACIYPPNLAESEITDVVSALPSGISEGNYQSYWTKSKFVIPDDSRSSIELDILNDNIDVCAGAFQVIDLPYQNFRNAFGGKNVKLNFKVKKDDYIVFSMSPAVQGKFDEETCKNHKEGIYVEDSDKCLKEYIGKEYFALIGDINNTETPNVIYRDYSSFKKLWMPGSSYVLKSEAYVQKTDAQKTYDQIIYDIANNGNKYLCTTNPQRRSEKGFDSYLANIKRHYTSRELNVLCRNFCVLYGSDENADDHLVEVENKNSLGCAMSESSFEYKSPTGGSTTKNDETPLTRKTYFEGLQVAYVAGYLPILKSKEELETGGKINPGILSGWPYKVELTNVDFLNFKYTSGIFSFLTGREGGGYKIRVAKDCSSFIKDKALYYYISNTPPMNFPGENGIGKLIPIPLDTKRFKYKINVSGQEGKNIYYGIASPEKDDVEYYKANHTGNLSITVKEPYKPMKFISRIVNYMKDTIFKKLYGNSYDRDSVNSSPVINTYDGIIVSSSFLKIVKALLVLYIMIHALYYILGRTKASLNDIFLISLKIALIVVLLSESSWYFFNNYLFRLFIKFPTQLANIMGSIGGAEYQDTSNDFTFLDNILGRFALPVTWIQIVSLFLAGPIGFFITFLIFWGIYLIVECLFSVIIVYLMSLIIIALLLSIAPFFIICILFKRTNLIFKNWITTLIQTSMRPVMGFIIIALLSHIMDSVIFSLFDFYSCTQCILNIDLDVFSFCLLSFFLPVGYSSSASMNDMIRETDFTSFQGSSSFVGMPLSITKVIIFIVLCNALKELVRFSSSMAISIFGSFADLTTPSDSLSDSISSFFGMDASSRSQRYNMKYYNSRFPNNSGGENRALPRSTEGTSARTPNVPLRPMN